MFRRFAVATRRILEAAEQKAREAGESTLGLRRLVEALAAALGIDIVDESPERPRLVPGVPGPPRYEAKVLDLLRDAFHLSIEMGDSLVLPSHLLLAALNKDDLDVQGAVDRMGPDMASLRLAAISALHPLASFDDAENPFETSREESPGTGADEYDDADDDSEVVGAVVVPPLVGLEDSGRRERQRALADRPERGEERGARGSPAALVVAILALVGITVGGILVSVTSPFDDSDLPPSAGSTPPASPPPPIRDDEVSDEAEDVAEDDEVDDGDLAGGPASLESPSDVSRADDRGAIDDVSQVPGVRSPTPTPPASDGTGTPTDALPTPVISLPPPTEPVPGVPVGPTTSTSSTSTSSTSTSTSTTTTTTAPVPVTEPSEPRGGEGVRAAHERHEHRRQGCGRGHERFGDPCTGDERSQAPATLPSRSRRTRGSGPSRGRRRHTG